MYKLPSTLEGSCLPSSLPARPSPQRPTYLESQIRQVVGGGSVKDHLLTQVGGELGGWAAATLLDRKVEVAVWSRELLNVQSMRG